MQGQWKVNAVSITRGLGGSRTTSNGHYSDIGSIFRASSYRGS
jgi:hypothetical protein